MKSEENCLALSFRQSYFLTFPKGAPNNLCPCAISEGMHHTKALQLSPSKPFTRYLMFVRFPIGSHGKFQSAIMITFSLAGRSRKKLTLIARSVFPYFPYTLLKMFKSADFQNHILINILGKSFQIVVGFL